MNDIPAAESPHARLTNEALVEAAAHHAAGRLTEAEQLYHAILAVQPEHADANFNLGLMAMQRQQAAAAVPFFETALAASPEKEPFWVAYVDALIEAGRHDTAREVLALGSRHGLAAEVVAALSRRLPPPSANKKDVRPKKVARTLADRFGEVASLLRQRRFADAEAGARQLTRRMPHNGNGWKLLGAALLERGQQAEALAALQKATALLPADAQAHSLLGDVMRVGERLNEAVNCYRKALSIDCRCVEAQNNLGLVLWQAGQIESALDSFRHALEVKPEDVMVLSNLGAGLLETGCPDQAEMHLRQAVRLQPGSTMALNNLALALKAQGKAVEAMNIAARSVGMDESPEAKEIFVECIRNVQLKWIGDDLRAKLLRALIEPWGRPANLVRTCISLVRNSRGVDAVVERSLASWPKRIDAEDLFGPNGASAIAADPVLKALLTSVPICDVELERFLTLLRYALLGAAADITGCPDEDHPLLELCGALAQQCFINEYIYSLADDEAIRAKAMRERLVAALESGSTVPALLITAVATYFPLHDLPLAERLLDRPWPPTVAAVLTLQVSEPREEKALRPTIPCLTGIGEGVSEQVRNQYEENPYPRWIKVEAASKARTVDQHLRRIMPLSSFRPLAKGADIDILIAGCGTGQQTVEAAQRYPGARILALDLSLTSLCYSKRKTLAAGLTSIEYAQADILKLASLDRHFDVIMSTGVLHHLADPLQGWRILLSLLRPGGLMYLGFYSELARRNIVRARAFIAERGYGTAADEIRRCRQEIIEVDASERFGTTTKSGDFFSLSGCRDLLFHVQEHRMTLGGIEAFLQENGLHFVGFELDAGSMQAYRRRFPDDPTATNLASWQLFEKENPDTFFGMYQFWVQKVT